MEQQGPRFHHSLQELIEDDMELFRQMSQTYSFFVDATVTIASQLNGKEMSYFAFLSFNRFLKIEPVPYIEMLTLLSIL